MRKTLTDLLTVSRLTSTNDKLIALKTFDTPTLRQFLFLAFSPTVLSGIETLSIENYNPLPSGEGFVVSELPELSTFLLLMRDLQSRIYTGNSAKARVIAFVELCQEPYAELITQIVTQKLRIGLGAAQINKALGVVGMIPVFGVQLAKEYEPGHLSTPFYVSHKLDGMRCLAFVKDGHCTLTSREGRSIDSVPHITEALRHLVPGVYDGELIHPGGFQITISACRSKTPKTEGERVVLHLFDHLTWEDWDDPKVGARDRFRSLKTAVDRCKGGEVVVVAHTLIDTTEELLKVHKGFVQKGYEGTMIQTLGAYVKKRGWHLMKLKDFLSTEAKVVGWEFGTGKLKKLMGTLHCVDTKSGVSFDCGSGFSNADRYRDSDYWIGKVIEVKYQELTEDNKPRFGTFLRLRGDL